MKKILVVALSFALLSVVSLVAEMTADEIISKHIAAIGGEAKLREVKSVMMQGTMFMQGMPLEFKMYAVPPTKSHIEVSMNNAVLGGGGTDGTNAWQTQMGTTYILSGELKNQAVRQGDIFSFFDYKNKGAKVRYLGEDLIKGAKTLKVEMVDSSNDTVEYYFDATTFQIVRQKDGNSIANYSNHKEVNGVIFPFKMTTQVEAAQQMITFDSVAINVPVDTSLFVMPKGAVPMPEMPGMPTTGGSEGK